MSKGTILIVDDDEAVLDTTCTLLEFFGYSTIQAKNGIEGISKYREREPGLVFLDVKMPKMDGYDTFFELKKEFPNSKVILMTAHADYSKLEDAKKLGVLDLIEKPYTAEKLKNMTDKFYPKK